MAAAEQPTMRKRVNQAAARGEEALLEGGRAAGLVELVGDGKGA